MPEKDLLEKVRESMGTCTPGYIAEIIDSIEFSHGTLTDKEAKQVQSFVEAAIEKILDSKTMNAPVPLKLSLY